MFFVQATHLCLPYTLQMHPWSRGSGLQKFLAQLGPQSKCCCEQKWAAHLNPASALQRPTKVVEDCLGIKILQQVQKAHILGLLSKGVQHHCSSLVGVQGEAAKELLEFIELQGIVRAGGHSRQSLRCHQCGRGLQCQQLVAAAQAGVSAADVWMQMQIEKSG